MGQIRIEAGLGHVDPVHANVGGSCQALADGTMSPGGNGSTIVLSGVVGSTPTVRISSRPNISAYIRVLTGSAVNCPRKFARRALHVVALVTVLCDRTGVADVFFGLAVAPLGTTCTRVRT